jgi:hypothetical protein
VGQQISDVPHAATQLPLAQQPPLQWSTDEQVVPHLLLTQAVWRGQSVATLQPQAPPTQPRPIVEALQLTHACPDAPQVDVMVPSAQVPALQHEPLPQVPSFAAPHALVQAPWWQVGVIPPHTWHVDFGAPHAPFASPCWHDVPSQQPLHCRPPAQDLAQTLSAPHA